MKNPVKSVFLEYESWELTTVNVIDLPVTAVFLYAITR